MKPPKNCKKLSQIQKSKIQDSDESNFKKPIENHSKCPKNLENFSSSEEVCKQEKSKDSIKTEVQCKCQKMHQKEGLPLKSNETIHSSQSTIKLIKS